MVYLFRGGDVRRRRVMHLGGFDPLTGSIDMRPICGRVKIRLNRSCNLPLGRPTCKHCLAKYEELQRAA